MVAELGVGELTLEGGEAGKQVFFVAGGYVDVASDAVTVLVDVAEKPGDIDITRAEKAKQRAEQRLERKTGDIDVVRAQAALARATQRLATAARTR
jgi:F-type H+-transporting ATPase subunit epsilon